MDIQQVRAFVAVADSGQVTKAAQALGYSQPAVSHQISALERQTGGPLFRREGGRMVLSQRGSDVLPYARVMIELAQRMRAP